jgi:thiamine pyrophosphate-dependent acetolactate synthase large subunit-like protein
MMARPSGRCSTPAAASSIRARRPRACCANSCADRLSDHLDADGARRLSRLRQEWLGMLGMHGTYEANWAMHDCDRDDLRRRALRRPRHGPLDAFSPNSRRRSISTSTRPRSTRTCRSISASSATRHVLEAFLQVWRAKGCKHADATALKPGGSRSTSGAGATASPSANDKMIKPQYAMQRLYELTKDKARHLHHHRSRPAPDVGGAVPALRGSRTAG